MQIFFEKNYSRNNFTKSFLYNAFIIKLLSFLCANIFFMILLSEITFEDTFPVRHEILRAGKPIETCFFDGDELPTTKHFGIFVNKKIMGVVSVFQNKNNTFNPDNQYQIRGMAVLEEAQKLGFGKQLVRHCETYVLEEKSSLIWFNARENATLFYEKLGYKKVGSSFLIADIGLHYLMFKKIG